MAASDGDDFNRLYERLVVRRSSKKKRADSTDTKTQLEGEAKQQEKDVEVLTQTSQAARLEEIKRKERQEHDAHISSAVKRLRLARNLHGFARFSRCSSHRLAFYLVDATEQDGRRLLKKYQSITKRKRTGRQEGRTSEMERCMRLERVAARLFRRQVEDFRPQAATTLEGRLRVIDELLLFSPPGLRSLSQIGYAERGNVVPAPPRRFATK